VALTAEASTLPRRERRQLALLTSLPQLLLSLRVDGLLASLQELFCGHLPQNPLTFTAAKVRSSPTTRVGTPPPRKLSQGSSKIGS
jgi:hypothetical protein